MHCQRSVSSLMHVMVLLKKALCWIDFAFCFCIIVGLIWLSFIALVYNSSSIIPCILWKEQQRIEHWNVEKRRLDVCVCVHTAQTNQAVGSQAVWWPELSRSCPQYDSSSLILSSASVLHLRGQREERWKRRAEKGWVRSCFGRIRGLCSVR